jgi:hypothetical protein
VVVLTDDDLWGQDRSRAKVRSRSGRICSKGYEGMEGYNSRTGGNELTNEIQEACSVNPFIAVASVLCSL